MPVPSPTCYLPCIKLVIGTLWINKWVNRLVLVKASNQPTRRHAWQCDVLARLVAGCRPLCLEQMALQQVIITKNKLWNPIWLWVSIDTKWVKGQRKRGWPGTCSSSSQRQSTISRKRWEINIKTQKEAGKRAQRACVISAKVTHFVCSPLAGGKKSFFTATTAAAMLAWWWENNNKHVSVCQFFFFLKRYL